jgi:hypothetical protein
MPAGGDIGDGRLPPPLVAGFLFVGCILWVSCKYRIKKSMVPLLFAT